MRWSSESARHWVFESFPKLCESPGVLAVVMFGSSIRPVASSFDFDCLYIFRGERPALPTPPMDVDLRGYEASQIDELIAAGHDLLGWSLRLGALVCEREEYWTQLSARWSGRLPFPSADTADDRAESAERMYIQLQEVGDADAAAEQYLTALTHRARAALLRAGTFPASRPELPTQLLRIGRSDLAALLDDAIAKRNAIVHGAACRPA